MINALALGMGMASRMPAQQGRALSDAMGQTMMAIGRENYSRVAQAREARRQAQERFLQSQQLQVELERIRQERELAEKQMKMAAAMQAYQADRDRGVAYSTRWKKMFDI